MEDLLQLHIVLPSDSESTPLAEYRPLHDAAVDRFEIEYITDDLIDLLTRQFPVPSYYDAPTEGEGTWLSTVLFEDRPDNRQDIETIRSQLEEMVVGATVIESQVHEEPTDRSTSQPDTHIILSITNWGVDQPSVRWQREKPMLDAAPLVIEDRIYHSGSSNLFALDAATGEELWTTALDDTTRVPVANGNIVVGSGNGSVTGLEPHSGEIRWHQEYNLDDEEFIDSRVRIDAEKAYFGLRTGDLVAISLDDGSEEIFHQFTHPVRDVRVEEKGILVYSGGSYHFVSWDGTLGWNQEFDHLLQHLNSHGTMLYGFGSGDLVAISLESGRVEWRTELKPINDIRVLGDALVVVKPDSLVGVNPEDGSILWERSTDEVMVEYLIGEEINEGVPCIRAKQFISEGSPSVFTENELLLVDESDGSETALFELGLGSYYPPVRVDDGLLCMNGNQLICLEELPI